MSKKIILWSSSTEEISEVPRLDGTRVFPTRLLLKFLNNDEIISGVYAAFNDNYFSSLGNDDGWGNCEYIGATSNIAISLKNNVENEGDSKCAFVKVISCETAEQSKKEMELWRKLVPQEKLLQMDENSWRWQAVEEEIISPFSDDTNLASSSPNDDSLPFTMDNVDMVLEEVRPYLISDGGNVSLQKLEKGNVFLILEGACGSCPSSTVTMKMGIERVLREKFDFGEVIQVTVEEEEDYSVLTEAAVQQEINRILPAIQTMGGIVEIRGVDPELGVVKIMFRGPNRIRTGLDLAIRDVKLVNHVEFVMD